MAYGTLATDAISTSGNLAVTGNIIPTGSVYATNAPGTNRIINGAMNIDQRNAGASQTITAAAALAYTVDRWYAYCTGANVTGQRVANTGTTTAPSQYAYQFTGASSVTAIGFGQRIEAVNCYDLAGTTATLSVNLSNSLLTTVTWTAYYANTTDTFGTLASPTRTQIATGTFTVTSTITRYSTQITIPSAATTGIEIVFSVGAQTTGTWVIGNVQLEAGSLMTYFERRTIGHEVVLCQRYFFSTISGNAYQCGGLGVCSGTYVDLVFYLPQPMRISPSLTLIGTISNFSIEDGLGSITPSSVVIQDGTGNLVNILNLRFAGGFTGGRAGRLYMNNAATAGMQFSAEL